ncbi:MULTISPECIES: SdpI family protein [unclassified Rhodococcus (in: high G+C Gram-positive bacteria)]|uniref:SdpI family protein n=1 Tax=unclassified Rhodococcus (in: high G+C Gram-positive bacteria) TaxID=192944 RepID=UPI00163ABD46|nr:MULTISPECIES: SdpI family protein [unclassified Rhodococcus (in: high G+C Gram-positive bacteria)]MBC2641040.1 SdpI family protein [Rhodococcus sp. 3A]MBC2894215.1 SdpI family protein [Rhodococcus sp. 4CII]
MLIASVVLFVLAVAVSGVAVAGLAERLPRNRWAGVRTPETMRDDQTFALANKVAGPTLLAAAGLLVIGGIAGILIGGVFGVGAVLVSVVAAALTAATGGSLGARAAAAVPAPDTGGCGSSCGACSLKGACQPS